MSTKNSPRLCLFPRHPLRSRTVGQACRLPRRQAWGQKEEPFNPGYTLAMLSRHSPDCGVFEARIALLTGLGNGKSPSPRANGNRSRGRRHQNGEARRSACTKACLFPLSLGALLCALMPARAVPAAGQSATGCRRTSVAAPRLRPSGRSRSVRGSLPSRRS